MARERTQAQRRRTFIARDQLGRKFAVTIELETGDPTVPVVPAGWNDPIRTPGKYIIVDPNNPRSAFTDLRRWYLDQRATQRDYKKLLREIGRKLYGERFDEKAPATAQMVEVAGEPPLDPQVILDAAKGDPELLGLKPMSDKVMARLNWEARAGAAADANEFDSGVEDAEFWRTAFPTEAEFAEVAAVTPDGPTSAELPEAPAGSPSRRQFKGGKRIPKTATTE